jgi:hypothetical protein
MRFDVYDNGGKTADRYTVVLDDSVFTMSTNAGSPQGVNQFYGDADGIIDQKKEDETVPEAIPMSVVRGIVGRCEDIIEDLRGVLTMNHEDFKWDSPTCGQCDMYISRKTMWPRITHPGGDVHWERTEPMPGCSCPGNENLRTNYEAKLCEKATFR